MVHSGSADIEPTKRSGVDRFIFFDQTAGTHLNKFERCVFNGIEVNLVQLKADKFSEEIFNAVDEWDIAMATNQQVQTEKANLLVIYSKGAVIHGVPFG
jgi:hypothetical protein